MESTKSALTADALHVREEVFDFMHAAERLLSPAMWGVEMSAEECQIISEYIMHLSHASHPWSKRLPIRYT